MKIVLIGLNAKYVHSNLAIYDLEAYTRQHRNMDSDLEFELLVKEFTINHNLDFILQELYREKADIYAFSCYIWNIYEVLSITKELKKVLPNAEIWLGGPEVSYDAEVFLKRNPWIEGILLGEGEVTFFELIKAWEEIYSSFYGYAKNHKMDAEGFEEDNRIEDKKRNGSEQEIEYNREEYKENEKKGKKDLEISIDRYQQVQGIIFRNTQDEIIQTAPRALMSLDDLPFIYEDLSKFANKILYYETSRGCPFSCSYCLSSIDKSVRFRSFAIVEKELDFFLKNQVPQVKFVDRTFNCDRKHALEIWRYLTEHDNGLTNFHFEIAADLIGEEELALFEKMRPGLIQLEIGLQSTNPETIREIRRVMDVEKVKKTLLKIRSFGNIHQHLDLIAGLPYEDFLSFQRSFNEAYAMKPNQLQLGFLKVLKGSYMGEQIRDYDLKYRDTQPYEVLCTKWISYDEILVLKKVEEMVEVYFNSDQFEHVLPYMVSFFESPYVFYESLGRFYDEQGLFGIGLKREARYQTLRDFWIAFLGFEGNFEKTYNRTYDIRNDINSVKKCDKTCDETFKKACGERMESKQEQNEQEKRKILSVFDSLLTFDYYLRENVKNRPSWAKEEPILKADYQAFFKNGGNVEISLTALAGKGYDSKAASHKMHIEPVLTEAYLRIEETEQNLEMGSLTSVSEDDGMQELWYCLFDYENRNPLTKDARFRFMREL